MPIRISPVGSGISERHEIDLSEITLGEARDNIGGIVSLFLKQADFDEKIRDIEHLALRILSRSDYPDRPGFNTLVKIDPRKYEPDSDQWYAAKVLNLIGHVRFESEELGRLAAGKKSMLQEVQIIRPSSMPAPTDKEVAVDRILRNANLAVCAAFDLGDTIREWKIKSKWGKRALNGLMQEQGQQNSQRRRAQPAQEIREYDRELLSIEPKSTPTARRLKTIAHFTEIERDKASLPDGPFPSDQEKAIRERVRKRVARALRKPSKR